MAIPPFDAILNVLPPHVGDPRDINQVSPYECTSNELCGRFRGTAERDAILSGFLDLRQELRGAGLDGFQWVSGSFVEDIKAQESRPPRDVDVVTFVIAPAASAEIQAAIVAKEPRLLSRNYVKAQFLVDHFVTGIRVHPIFLIRFVRYWYGLFSHRRDRVWKGMLILPFSQDPTEDDAARQIMAPGP